MKKFSFILSLFTILIAFGCGGNTNTEEGNTKEAIRMQEDSLAREAQNNALKAKKEAISTEQEVEELLKEI